MNSTMSKQLSEMLENKYIVIDISDKNKKKHIEYIFKSINNNKIIFYSNKTKMLESIVNVNKNNNNDEILGYIVYKGLMLGITNDFDSSFKMIITKFINGENSCCVCYEKTIAVYHTTCMQCGSIICDQCKKSIINVLINERKQNYIVKCPICSVIMAELQI